MITAIWIPTAQWRKQRSTVLVLVVLVCVMQVESNRNHPTTVHNRWHLEPSHAWSCMLLCLTCFTHPSCNISSMPFDPSGGLLRSPATPIHTHSMSSLYGLVPRLTTLSSQCLSGSISVALMACLRNLIPVNRWAWVPGTHYGSGYGYTLGMGLGLGLGHPYPDPLPMAGLGQVGWLFCRVFNSNYLYSTTYFHQTLSQLHIPGIPYFLHHGFQQVVIKEVAN